MSSREFNYRKHVFNGRESSFPTIPLSLRHMGRTMDTDALVDTGSTFSIFKPEISDALGIPLERGKKIPIATLRELTVGYLHKLEMQVLDEFFECEVAFSRDLKFSLNLLGRAGFLDRHELAIRQPEKKIMVKEIREMP